MSVAMAATTAGSAIAAITSSNKIIRIPLDYHYRNTLIPNTHFTFKTKLIKPLKLKPQQFAHTPPPIFLLSRASASFEQSTQLPEIEPFSETQQEDDDEEEEQDDFDQNETESTDAGRLYVGNLPYAMTSSQLSEVFSEAGGVVSVEIVYDRVTDRSRGFAFVTMGSIEAAKEAIRMFDGSQVGGRTVKVNFPEVPRGGEREIMGPKIRSSNQGFVDSPYKIYAGNLSWNLTSQGLREAFFDQPGLLSVKVIYDRASGRSRGFGFITFSSAQDVESALAAMNGLEVEGRPLRLNKAEERAPTTPLTQDN